MHLSELRFDPFKKIWVIISVDRSTRPSHFSSDVDGIPGEVSCPFCSGNEHMTPPESFAIRESGSAPDSPGWSIRVVPNKFPAISNDVKHVPLVEEPFSSVPAFGVHEVVIETTDHQLQMTEYSSEKTAEVLQVYRQRIRDHFSDRRFRSVFVFKNHRKESGASLYHAHTQITALPFVPETLKTEVAAFSDCLEKTGKCLMCATIGREIEDAKRVVIEDEKFLVFAPFASAFPYEIMIAPREHEHDFSRISDDDSRQLASCLISVLGRLKASLGDPPFNMILHTAPAGEDGFHWHIEIIPRVTKMGGFEWGSGVMINTVSPEEAALQLRAAAP